MTDTSADAPKFDTLAIHAGATPDPSTGARATPIYQTTSFVFNDADHAAALFGLEAFGNIYTRIMNPTQAVLEARVAALEGGTAALAVSSGHAAQFLVFHTLLEPGDEFVAGRQLYGGSVNQFNHSFKKFNWNVAWADATDPASFERAITPKTKAIFCESIANPGGIVVDVAAIAAIAKKAGITTKALYKVNGATETTPLFAGTTICLPDGTVVPGPATFGSSSEGTKRPPGPVVRLRIRLRFRPRIRATTS
jgi:O-acetylhomoserine (thiol)-lyase